MTWTYSQSTGHLSLNDTLVGIGYSGAGAGMNNTAMQDVQNKGPIPQGGYTIGPAYDDIDGKGPCVFHLEPKPDTDTFDRLLFRMHGDNSTHTASHGCIVMPPNVRHQVRDSSDTDLMVIA